MKRSKPFMYTRNHFYLDFDEITNRIVLLATHKSYQVGVRRILLRPLTLKIAEISPWMVFNPSSKILTPRVRFL